MVYRIYVEKKQGLTAEADALRNDIVNLLGIKGLTGLRLLNRYDAEQLDKNLFDYCTKTVFSEPQLDDLREEIPTDGAAVFAVEYLPGQFDQRVEIQFEVINVRFNVEQVADLPRHDAHFEQRLSAVEFAADRFGIQVAVERFGGRVVQVDTEFFQHFFSRAP